METRTVSLGRRGHIQHSTLNITIQHLKNKREREIRAPLKVTQKEPTYERSPFSCSSWQSIQNGVQGTADRRLSPMVAPQLVQVP